MEKNVAKGCYFEIVNYMNSVIFLIIVSLSLFAANGSILGTEGDYLRYKDLLYELNFLNFNLTELNLKDTDLFIYSNRYGLIWILIMKIHTLLFGGNFQIFVFNLSFITLSVKYFFLKIIHKKKITAFISFFCYLLTLFVVQEALRMRGSLSICFALALFYFLYKQSNYKNIKKLFFLVISILLGFCALNINYDGFYLAILFIFDFIVSKMRIFARLKSLKILKNKVFISLAIISLCYIFSSIFIERVKFIANQGLLDNIFPYLISDSNYISSLYFIPIIFTLIIHIILSSIDTYPIKSSFLMPFFISFIIGMILKSQYLLYSVLNISYFYMLSFKETFSKRNIFFIFISLTAYYFIIRTLPLVYMS